MLKKIDVFLADPFFLLNIVGHPTSVVCPKYAKMMIEIRISERKKIDIPYSP